MQRAAHAYLQTQVTTTNQGEVVILLYDGAIKFLTKAKELLAQNDMAGKGNSISKALDIIHELESSLNLEKGGELAMNLHSLYSFCSRHLLMANLKKSPEMIDEVIRILAGLRSAYAEILNQPEAQAAAQEAAANMRASAILPPRAQAGNGSSGTATPAPGANARMRSLYAKASRQQGGPAAATVIPEQKTEDSEAAEALAAPGSLPPAGSLSPEAEKDGFPSAEKLPFGSGFSPRLPGGGLYKKYAAMQK